MVLQNTNPQSERAKRVLEGEVVSDKMDKTITVSIVRRLSHPKLGKTINRSKHFKVHDEKNEAKCGDWVEIIECRPISKYKHMRLGRIIKRAE
jgi:small subunit ribosomal protein S17